MELRLPDLTGSSEKAVITCWYAAENSQIVERQDLVEVMTDKATFCIPAPCNGILRKIIKKEREEAETGELIAEIQEDASYMEHGEDIS